MRVLTETKMTHEQAVILAPHGAGVMISCGAARRQVSPLKEVAMNDADAERAAFDQALIDGSQVEWVSDGEGKQPKSRHNNEEMVAALKERWDRAKAEGFRGSFLPPWI
jgi:hypothetical protein